MVPRSALEVPQVFARGGIIGGEEPLGVSREDQASAVASTPATIGERVLTSHLMSPVATSMALNAPDASPSISVSELPQYGCPLMKKALPEVNLAQLLITGTYA